MLDPLDDFPIHQAPVSVAHNPQGLNAYDRYFFNGYADRADGHDPLFFAVALGVYPNRGVIDAAFSCVIDGVQHSVLASRRLGNDRRELEVGPIRITVDEPMRRFGVTVDHESVVASLRFDARSEPLEEPRFTLGPTFDYTRFTQFGSWTGSYTIDGTITELAERSVVGCRDRSWGQRSVGPAPGVAPRLPQFFWLWAPLNFDDGVAHFDVNEFADGRRWHDAGFVAPLLGDGPVDVMRTVDHSISLEIGTRWPASAELELVPWGGRPSTRIRLEPIERFQMRGLGYLHPTRGHGSWQGEDVAVRETIDLANVDPATVESLHVQQLVRATIEGTGATPERVGLGALETLILGDHLPLGLHGVTDPAS